MTEPARLKHRVAFSETVSMPDGSGGMETSWVLRFTVRAEFKHLNGSETVMAGRLAGRHSQIIRIRASDAARQINPSWKATDERGREYNIRDVTETEGRDWIDVLAESGVPT